MAPQASFSLGVPIWLLAAAGVALVFVVLVVVVLVLILRGGTRRVAPAEIDLRINVLELPAGGPLATGPRLEFYGTPVRLAVVVLAPAGRRAGDDAPPMLGQLLDSLVPGLAPVAAMHRPLIRWWPAQLSTPGFASAFFHNVSLPGDRGKATPWCSVAGRFEAGPQQYLAGLVCVADEPNSLSQVTVAHSGEWLRVLRVQMPSAA